MSLLSKLLFPGKKVGHGIIQIMEINSFHDRSQIEIAVAFQGHYDGAIRKTLQLPILDSSVDFNNLFKRYFEQRLNTKTEERIAERAFTEYGRKLFEKVFLDSYQAKEIYKKFYRFSKNNIEIDIIGNSHYFQSILWETLIDRYKSNKTFQWKGSGFLRRPREHEKERTLTIERPNVINILLVSSRVHEKDIPRNTVSLPLIKMLAKNDYPAKVTILRPASLKALQEELLCEDCPYDIVHLDTHGKTFNKAELLKALEEGYQVIAQPNSFYKDEEEAKKAFLILESDEDNSTILLDAQTLSNWVSASQIKIVVLNACYGAGDGKSKVFANELIQFGVGNVVAFQYEALTSQVVTFLSVFYKELLDGNDMVTSSIRGRSHLYVRQKYGASRQRFDWMLPVIYTRYNGCYFKLENPDYSINNIPARAFDSVKGRDNEMFKLESILKENQIAILYASPGSGKNSFIKFLSLWWKATGFISMSSLQLFSEYSQNQGTELNTRDKTKSSDLPQLLILEDFDTFSNNTRALSDLILTAQNSNEYIIITTENSIAPLADVLSLDITLSFKGLGYSEFYEVFEEKFNLDSKVSEYEKECYYEYTAGFPLCIPLLDSLASNNRISMLNTEFRNVYLRSRDIRYDTIYRQVKKAMAIFFEAFEPEEQLILLRLSPFQVYVPSKNSFLQEILSYSHSNKRNTTLLVANAIRKAKQFLLLEDYWTHFRINPLFSLLLKFERNKRVKKHILNQEITNWISTQKEYFAGYCHELETPVIGEYENDEKYREFINRFKYDVQNCQFLINLLIEDQIAFDEELNLIGIYLHRLGKWEVLTEMIDAFIEKIKSECRLDDLASKKTDFARSYYRMLLTKSQAHKENMNFDSAEKTDNEIFDAIKDNEWIQYALWPIEEVLPEEDIIYALKSFNILDDKQKSDLIKQAPMCLKFGLLYINTAANERPSTKFLEIAAEIFEKCGDRFRQAETYYHLTRQCIITENYEEAEAYYFKARELFEFIEKSNTKPSLHFLKLLHIWGAQMAQFGGFRPAEILFETVKEGYDYYGYQLGSARLLMIMAHIRVQQFKLEEAEDYAYDASNLFTLAGVRNEGKELLIALENREI